MTDRRIPAILWIIASPFIGAATYLSLGWIVVKVMG